MENVIQRLDGHRCDIEAPLLLLVASQSDGQI